MAVCWRGGDVWCLDHSIKLLKAVMFSLAFLPLAAEGNLNPADPTSKPTGSCKLIITRLELVFRIRFYFFLVRVKSLDEFLNSRNPVQSAEVQSCPSTHLKSQPIRCATFLPATRPWRSKLSKRRHIKPYLHKVGRASSSGESSIS